MANQNETPLAGARDAVTDAAESLRGLAGVIRKHGTCAPAALELVAERLEALTGKADRTQPAAPETTNSTEISSKLVVGNTAAPGMVDASWPLSLMRAGNWREVYIGHKCMKLECAYDYDAWLRLMTTVEAALAAQPAPVDEPDKDYDSEGSGYYQCLIDVEKGIQELALSMGWDTDSSAYEVSRYIESFPVPEKYWKGAHLRYKVETAAPAQPAPVVGVTDWTVRLAQDSLSADLAGEGIPLPTYEVMQLITRRALLSARPGGEGEAGVLCGMTPGQSKVEFLLRAGAIPEWLDFGTEVTISAHPAQAGGEVES